MNVKITDMKEFLQAVDSCTGDVYLVYPRGGTENIRLNPMRQAELVDECYIIGDWAKGECLTLTLDLEERWDHRKLKRFAVK